MSEATINIPQSINKVKLEGILATKDLKIGQYTRKSDNQKMDYIGGNLTILVEKTLNEKNITMEIPVNVFANKYDSAGGIGASFKSLNDVMTTMKSIAEVGKDNADRVRITNGQLTTSEFYADANNLVSQPRITSGFVNKVTGSFTPTATFIIEIMVDNLHRVVDNDGVELDPPRLEMNGIVGKYGNNIDIIKFCATEPDIVATLEAELEAGKWYHLNGDIEFINETIETEQVGKKQFGKTVPESQTINRKDFIINGGDLEPLMKFEDVTNEMLREANANRLSVLKDKFNKRNAAAAPQKSFGSAFDVGF